MTADLVVPTFTGNVKVGQPLAPESNQTERCHRRKCLLRSRHLIAITFTSAMHVETATKMSNMRCFIKAMVCSSMPIINTFHFDFAGPVEMGSRFGSPRSSWPAHLCGFCKGGD